MDRNQIIGLTLMFAVLAVYFTWFAPDPPEPTEATETQTIDTKAEGSIEGIDSTATASLVTQNPAEVDSLKDAENLSKFGALAFAASGEEETYSVSNEDLEITFSNKGGTIEKVVLLNHLDTKGDPFVIMEPAKSVLNIALDQNGKKLSLNDLTFQPTSNQKGDTTEVLYTADNGNIKIQHCYQIPAKGFSLGYKLITKNLDGIVGSQGAYFNWFHKVNHAEGTIDDSRLNSNVRYYMASEEYDELSERSEDYEEATLSSEIKWVSFKQKFFTIGVIADEVFQSGFVNQKVDPADSTTVKNMSMALNIRKEAITDGFGLTYYFGTNKYKTLKKVTAEFEENLDMGWGPLPLVNKFLIIPIFDFLQGFVGNYGLIIIILVVFIRLILSPLTYKSHMSMAKMRAMKPELDELKAKHEGDMQKQQQEQMKLYQQVGINPLSGCIPMLLQMPILFSLFFFFPNAVDLRGESFLWANDLSTYDSIINLPFEIPFYGDHVSLFTLLMTLSTLLYTWSNSQITTVQGPMQTLQYIMPVMFLFVLNSYASGLTFYYFVSNMTTFGQTMLFRRFIDDKKIHKTLQENKKKNATKGKSKFQQRLEDAMKAKQESQRTSKKKKK